MKNLVFISNKPLSEGRWAHRPETRDQRPDQRLTETQDSRDHRLDNRDRTPYE